MKIRRFLISSLAIVGLIPPMTAKASTGPAFALEPQSNAPTLFEIFKRDHLYDLAAHGSHVSHSSHSSHSSHASHASHVSSSSGGYSPPVFSNPSPPKSSGGGGTNYSLGSGSNGGSSSPYVMPGADLSTSPPATRGSTTANTGGTTVLPGNAAKFTNIVMQVQTALYAFGYYAGPLTGVVDPATRAALSDMQNQFGLPANGKITPETLDALGVTAE